MGVLVLVGLLAGCGGGATTTTSTAAVQSQVVVGGGFRFAAPVGWKVKRTASSATVSPVGSQASLVAVYVLNTTKPYRPSLWTQASAELDRSAKQLAHDLKGTLGTASTIDVARDKARQYRVDYAGKSAIFTFLFRGHKEYELLCRWAASAAEPAACALLTGTFRPI